MSTFAGFFVLELKRFISKKNIIIFILFLLLSLYFVQEGVNDYKDIIENKENFQEIERENIKKFINYNQYGTYGFRLLFVPSPLSIFFSNSGMVSELTAFVDSGIRLRIYNSYLGKNLYVEKSGDFKDFFGIILLLGSLLCMFLGYDSFLYREYVKFLASILQYQKVFFPIILARFILFFLFFLATISCSLILMGFNDISLTGSEYFHLLIYVLLMLLLFFFFFILGILGGCIKSKYLGIISLIVLWFGLIFLLPGTISRLLSKKANHITSAYNLEQKKLQLLSDFENKALDEAQRYTSMKERKESERRLVESYWNNEFQKIQAYEKKMQKDMKDNLKFYHKLSMLAPTTFYLSVHDEISSKGYENFFNFYQYIQRLQREFVRFYFNRRFYTNYGEIESFVKDDENVFYARSRLPEYFAPGLVLTIFYIAILTIVSYYRFKLCLFVSPDKEGPDPNKMDLQIKRGESVVLLTTAPTVINQLYNVLSGFGNRFKGRVTINGIDIASNEKRKKADFIYLCQPDKIPENIKAGDFVLFFKKLLDTPEAEMQRLNDRLALEEIGRKNFRDLKDNEKGKILFFIAQLKNSHLYMIHDFVRGMPLHFIVEFKDQVKKLKEAGASILYLSNDVPLASKIGDRVSYLINDPSVPHCLDTYTEL